MKRKSLEIALVLSLIILAGFTGCFEMKDSGKNAQTQSTLANERELDTLRITNRRLRKENEDLKTVNSELEGRLKDLGKRDEKLSQKINVLEVDLRQRTLLTEGLLNDKKDSEGQVKELQKQIRKLDAQIEELRANLNTRKKTESPGG